MADSWQTRINHLKLLLRNLPGLLWSAQRRQKYSEMARFSRVLPARLNAPLPEALAALTPLTTVEKPISDTQETLIRELADLAALIDRRSPLGLCLRRSLTRYYYLRKAGYPVKIHFGARFVAGKPRSPDYGPCLVDPQWSTLS